MYINTYGIIGLLCLGIVLGVAVSMSAYYWFHPSPKEKKMSAVNQKKVYDLNSVIYRKDYSKPFPCIVCGCLTRINDTECAACGNTTP